MEAEVARLSDYVTLAEAALFDAFIDRTRIQAIVYQRAYGCIALVNPLAREAADAAALDGAVHDAVSIVAGEPAELLRVPGRA